MKTSMSTILALAPAAFAAASLPAPAFASGPATYGARCAVCHQAGGAGTAQFPRLSGRASKIAATPAGRVYIIKVVLFGVFGGGIKVDGKPINGMMPAQGTLSDQDAADVLNHVTSLGGGKPKPFTAAEVKAVRDAGKLTSVQVGKERQGLAAKGVMP